MEELQYPKWQNPLREAQAETDLDKLPEKLMAAESALFLRMQELATSNDGHRESSAIQDAFLQLLRIKTENSSSRVSIWTDRSTETDFEALGVALASGKGRY
jgi:hypothetical protein